MKALKSKIGKILSGTYISALGLIFLILLAKPTGGEFLGVYLIILTLPWSLIFDKLTSDLGTTPVLVEIVSFGFFAVINTFILYKIGAAIEGAKEFFLR